MKYLKKLLVCDIRSNPLFYTVALYLTLASFSAFSGPYEVAMCDDGNCGGGSPAGIEIFFGWLLILSGVLYWFINAGGKKSTRIWYTVVIGSFGIWAIDHHKLIPQILGWLLLISVALVWYWAGDTEDVANQETVNRKPSTEVPVLIKAAEKTPGASQTKPRKSSPNTTILVNAPEKTFVALQTDNALGKAWCFDGKTRILKNITTGVKYSEGKYIRDASSVHVSGFHILHGEDIWVNDRDVNFSAKDTDIGARSKTEKLILEALAPDALVALVIRQYEDGPWWGRVYNARDVASAFMRTDISDITYKSADELWCLVTERSESILQEFVDSKKESLAEAESKEYSSVVKAIMNLSQKNRWQVVNEKYLQIEAAHNFGRLNDLDEEVKQILAKNAYDEMDTSVISHTNCPTHILEILAGHPDPQIRSMVASHPNCSQDAFNVLAGDRSGYVRIAVANNPVAPIAVLVLFSKSPFYEYRKAVALNPSTPLEVLDKLAHDQEVKVRNATASRIRKYT